MGGFGGLEKRQKKNQKKDKKKDKNNIFLRVFFLS